MDLLDRYSVDWQCAMETEQFAAKLDALDPLQAVRSEFHMPTTSAILATLSQGADSVQPSSEGGDEAVYLCGNSLGLQPKSIKRYIDEELTKWAQIGVLGHFNGKRPWRDIDDVRYESSRHCW